MTNKEAPTSLPPLLWQTSIPVLFVAVRLHLKKASQSSLPLLCMSLYRCTIYHVLIPALSSDAKPVVFPSSADSPMTQSGYISYSQGFASISPPTAPPHISSQVISNLESHITTRIRTLHAHDDTVDPNMPIPMKVSPHPSKSSLSTPDIAVNILRSGDGQQGQSQS